MVNSHWTTLRPQPGMPEWTVVTGQPSRAERMAVRSYQMNLSTPRPWWSVMLLQLLPIVWLGLRAWVNGALWAILLMLVSLAFGVIWAWERQGFLDLLGRYDAELRHVTSEGRAP
jgi:hypothetical protein